MKIGILTFVNTANYGASLQAYALQQVVNSRGHECEIISYMNEDVIKAHDPKEVFKRRGLKKVIAPYLFYIYKKRLEKFKTFERKYCKFSEICDRSTILELSKKYDRIIVGSDQVWNLDITGGDETFFLDYLDDAKKYSYAASTGTSYFTTDVSICEKLVDRFQLISVREQATVDQLKTNLKRDDIECNVDPTLLRYNDWKAFVSEKPINDSYIFMYLTPENDELLNAVRNFADKENCKIILLKKGAGKRKGIRIVNIASPDEFINYIAHAKYVITGSFHALCFSLMLHTDFYVTSSKQKNRSGRLVNLLHNFGLEDRLVLEPKYCFQISQIDFYDVDM